MASSWIVARAQRGDGRNRGRPRYCAETSPPSVLDRCSGSGTAGGTLGQIVPDLTLGGEASVAAPVCRWAAEGTRAEG